LKDLRGIGDNQTLSEHVEGMNLPTVTGAKWTGKAAETYTYGYINGVPLRDGDDALLVNECELTVTKSFVATNIRLQDFDTVRSLLEADYLVFRRSVT